MNWRGGHPQANRIFLYYLSAEYAVMLAVIRVMVVGTIRLIGSQPKQRVLRNRERYRWATLQRENWRGCHVSGGNRPKCPKNRLRQIP
jgi:hypothetical protein